MLFKRIKAHPDDVFSANSEKASIGANLLDLEHLNEATIFLNLTKRSKKNLMYTLMGGALISVNPHCDLSIYTEDVQQFYLGLPNWQTQRLSPHLYSIAQHAYSEMLHSDGEPQTIVLSGRAGSGKTEACKRVLEFVDLLGGAVLYKKNGNLLTQALSILGAFGNAKTKENSNSSRFGLLTQIRYACSGAVCGGFFVPYLFERTRVSVVESEERNFHVFYQLLKGATAEEKKSFVLYPASKYKYLTMGGCTEIDGVDDAQEFEQLRKAMVNLNMPQKTVQSVIFRTLSAVLHLGNVNFGFDEKRERVYVKSKTVLKIVAQLLGCSDLVLEKEMCGAKEKQCLTDEGKWY